MRFLLLSLFFILNFHAFSQEDYTLQIDDSSLPIALDKEYSLMHNGKEITIKLTAKDTLIYDDQLFSFKYPKDYKVSSLTIDVGIEQIMLMTAEGSGLVIQKYSTLNPTMLNEMMINEVTKESLNYGYKMERQDYSRDLKSGQKIEVDKAVLKYKDETNVYEIASIGNKDEGILIMTMIMDDELSVQGKKIIDLMWKSLVVK